MEYYTLKFAGLERKLPIVSLTPKIRVASFNLLGDAKFVQVSAKEISKILNKIEFDCLVGPEVKVVPVLQELSKILGHERYVIFRKNITGYMVEPKKSKMLPGLYLDGRDATYLKGKKVVVIDDVVTTGKTLRAVGFFLKEIGANVVYNISVFTQAGAENDLPPNFAGLSTLPVFLKEK